MRFSSIITLGLLTTSVSAVRGRRFRRQKKPENPIDPGITPKCTFYDTWVDDDLDCLLWLEDWSITPEQFSEYVSIHSIYQLSLWYLKPAVAKEKLFMEVIGRANSSRSRSDAELREQEKAEEQIAMALTRIFDYKVRYGVG